MNKAWKGILIASVICLILGVILLSVSMMSGGSLDRIRRNVSVSDLNESFDGKDITSLSLRVGVGKVSLLPGEEFRVEAENIAADYFVCQVRDGVLVVEDNWTNSWSLNLSRGLSFRHYEPRVRVFIPDGFEFKRADVAISAGECRIDGLAAQTLNIEVSAGSIEAVDVRSNEFSSAISAGHCRIDGLITKRAALDVSAGQLIISGMQADECRASQSAGSSFIAGDIRGRGVFTCGIGRVAVNLEGRPIGDYTISLDVGLGAVTVNGSAYPGGTILGNGESAIDLTCDIGEIALTVG